MQRPQLDYKVPSQYNIIMFSDDIENLEAGSYSTAFSMNSGELCSRE